MEADQRSRIGKAGRVERFQQLYDVSGFVGAESVAAGFKLGEVAIERVRSHGDSRQEYLMASVPGVTLLMMAVESRASPSGRTGEDARRSTDGSFIYF